MESTNPARRLDKRLWLSLGLFTGLIILHQFLIQPALIQMTSDAPAINLAGRQRMLSQKLAKAALAFVGARETAEREARRAELTSTLQAWQVAHSHLVAGGPVGLFQRALSPAIQTGFHEIEPHFRAMAKAAEELLTDPDDAARHAALEAILRNEPEFLTRMHTLVGLYEDHARRHVQQLQILGLSIMAVILGVQLLMQFGVMRPALTNVGREWEKIEADYELLVESMTDGLVVFDQTGRVQFANRRLGDMLGRSPNQLIGEPAAIFVSEGDRGQFEKLLTGTSTVAGPLDLQLRA